MDVSSVLRPVEALAGFDDDALRRLAGEAWVAEYGAGQRILAIGQVVEAIGVVASGRVEAGVAGHPDDERVAIPPGELFGEISLLTGEPAIVEVVAAAPSRVVHVPHAALTAEIGRAPLAARALARLLTERLLRRDDDPDEQAAVDEARRELERSDLTEVRADCRDRPIPIGVSAHHIHLCQAHVEQLFGPGHRLAPSRQLSQPGGFACAETVDLIGPEGRVDQVRILGPARPQTQVEISRTEEYELGVDAPIRASGDVAGTPGLTLVGPAGEVVLEQGVICAQRHIHISPENALAFGLRDRDVVRVDVAGERSLTFGDVLVRVHPDYLLEMHIDTDEANAAEIDTGMTCTIDSIQRRGVT
jgi:propanediol utilization protein